MLWGEGGGYGQCSLCGSIAAGCTFINMACEKKAARAMITDLFKWYEQTSLPLDITQKMANEKKFGVEKYKSTEIFKPTIADSPLCHISVTRWCKENGYASGSEERSERCSRLTADVAHWVAVQMNKNLDVAYEKGLAMSSAAESCGDCHAKGKTFDEGGWTRGEMDCQPCHGQEINVSKGHYVGFDKK